jgi:hypothetical protein
VEQLGKGQDSGPARSRAVLAMVAERMSQFDLPWAWGADQIQGDVLRGPGTLAIELQENHTESDAHLDLAFILNVDNPTQTTIFDCTTGFGVSTEDAWGRAVGFWAELTAATIVELFKPANQYAEHQHGNDPLGFPGWHMISAGWIGFGRGEQRGALAQWAADQHLVTQLASVISTGLDRDHLNGVKIIFGGTSENEIAEVRINGQWDETASGALLALPWPRPPHAVFAQSFLLLPHPENDACGKDD